MVLEEIMGVGVAIEWIMTATGYPTKIFSSKSASGHPRNM